MIREYTVNLPMPRIMVQPEELPILTSGPFGGYQLNLLFFNRRQTKVHWKDSIRLAANNYFPSFLKESGHRIGIEN